MSDVKLTHDQKPLLVEKAAGMWSARSQNNPETAQDQVLYAVLEAIGGLNIDQPDGLYEFNVTPGPENTLVIKLTPSAS
jgi:hypothetical protein